jgi:hypothetical protein
MTITRFMDMHSGGGQKEDWAYIYIEAPEYEARRIFYGRFGHNPERVTCTCCGDDYSIMEEESLQKATAYERGCGYVFRRPDGTECDQSEGRIVGKGMKPGYTSGYEERPSGESWRHYQTLDEYIESDSVLFIAADEIKPEWRVSDVPEQGYVWAG